MLHSTLAKCQEVFSMQWLITLVAFNVTSAMMMMMMMMILRFL